MADPFDVEPSRHRAAGDSYYDGLEDQANHLPAEIEGHALDGEEARKTLRQVLTWYYHEKDRQADRKSVV